MVEYHDTEWGELTTGDQELFELLILEGAQAGLSWETILNKRQNYRLAFDNFDPKIVAKYDQAKIEELIKNPGSVRNKLKINSAVKNAATFLKVQAEFGSFYNYLKTFSAEPIINSFATPADIPASTDLSKAISDDLKKRGFNFVGPTIIYAFMQSSGMVIDHTAGCFKC